MEATIDFCAHDNSREGGDGLRPPRPADGAGQRGQASVNRPLVSPMKGPQRASLLRRDDPRWLVIDHAAQKAYGSWHFATCS